MSSSPPAPRDSRPALPRVAEGVFRARARDESVLFFCIEGAPGEACRTENEVGGCITFDTKLRGRVLSVREDVLELAVDGSRVLVRHLLPSAIDLAPLSGQDVEVHIRQRYAGRGRATIDAEISDPVGRLLLWAHDGRPPADSHGLALRSTVDADGHRLAVGHAGGVVTLRAPELVRVRLGSDPFDLALVRAGADDLAFVLVRC